MESERSGISIEKLRDDNFHTWKKRIRFVLSIRELDEFVDEDPPNESSPEYKSWLKRDKKAQAVIGLSLTDTHLEQVQHATSAKEMWAIICDIFEKHTLLNKLAARRCFYSASMDDNEKVLAFSARIRQLASSLKSMGVNIDDQELAMAFLCGLPDRFDGLISAIDALGDEHKSLTFQFAVSRAQQEEQRHSSRDKEAQKRSETAALLASRMPRKGNCIHCGKHNNSDMCYFKYPHLAPEGHPLRRRNEKALLSQHSKASVTTTEDLESVCLIGAVANQSLHNGESFMTNSSFCLSAKTSDDIASRIGAKWVIDTGCTSHLTFNRSVFSEYRHIPHSSVDLGGDSSSAIVGEGDVEIDILVDGKRRKCKVKNVKHAPSLRYQLLSVSTMARQGITAHFDRKGAVLKRDLDGVVIAVGELLASGLYVLLSCDHNFGQEAALLAPVSLWHNRLGHVCPKGIKYMADHQIVKGLTIMPGALPDCVTCILGKGHRTAIPKQSNHRAQKLLELVHSDVLGPLPVSSLAGAKYIITFIDDFSNWVVEYTMRRKSDALKCFKEYKAYAELHTEQKLKTLAIGKNNENEIEGLSTSRLKTLRSDNGGEYVSNEFKAFLAECGIKHQLTVAYTPQQNGVAERMNRTLLDLVRSMLLQKNIGKSFWAEAISTAVYIRNRVTSKSLPRNVTPYHLWHGEVPNLSHMRVFGSLCWYILPKHKLKKLDSRAKQGIMMGYCKSSKGYRVWDCALQKIVVSRDVRFDEDGSSAEGEVNRKLFASNFSPETISFLDRQDSPDDDPSLSCTDDTPDELEEDGNDVQSKPLSTESDHQSTQSVRKECDATEPNSLRRSSRARKQTEWWSPGSSTALNVISLLATADGAPESYSHAISPQNVDFWMPGIKKEENAIRENNTFSLVTRRSEMNVIPCRYVFRIKNGGPKVRIVAKGFRQVHGIDFTETYAPVVSLAAVRCFLALTAQLDLECDQMDVVTAFLNGDLSEDIYMEVPAGFRDTNRPNLVCKLHKALYGLKQAPRQWFAKINSFLLEKLHFTSSSYEPCLYFKHSARGIFRIVLYVDDLLIASDNRTELDNVKTELKRHFKMKDLGYASEFLGIEISRSRGEKNIHLCQFKYASKILNRFNMDNSKPCSTPMEHVSSMSTFDVTNAEQGSETFPYRQAIGCLMYLMVCTRPDIAFAVGRMSQYCENPQKSHWTAVKRIFRYVNGTRSLGLKYSSAREFKPDGYCDSDWGGCLESRKSTEGFVFVLGGGAVTWRSKKQTVVATSTCEAEYIAAYAGSKEAIWLSRMLAEVLGLEQPLKIILHIDNQGCIDMARGTSLNNRNKHIDIRFHFVRDIVSKKLLELKYVPAQNQIADPLTKPLQRALFETLRSSMGLSISRKSEQ